MERSLGFILLEPENPWRVWSGNAQDLIFKISPDLNKETKNSSPFILPPPPGDGEAPGASKGLQPAYGDHFEPGQSCEPTLLGFKIQFPLLSSFCPP